MIEKFHKKFHTVDDKANIQPKSFYTFFCEKAIYQIPLYQRPYSWTKKEVLQLLKDIEKSVDKDEDWFLGPIFTAAEDHDASSSKKYINLLDGQQRITTLILISRIIASLNYFNNGLDYRLLGSLDEYKNVDGSPNLNKIKEVEELREKNESYLKKYILIESSPFSSDESKFKTDASSKKELENWILQISKIRDKESYEEYKYLPINSPRNDYQVTRENLNRNIDIIYDYFEQMIENGKTLTKIRTGGDAAKGIILLNEFTNFLLGRLYFIHIPLREKNDVLDIFESLNNRGKKLTLTNLIKFRTLKSYINNKPKSDNIKKEWSKLYKNVQKLKDYFSDSDVFLERFINSKADKSNGYTEDDARIDQFENLYNSNYEKGMNDLNHALSMIIYITDKDGYFLNDLETKVNRAEKDKAKCLIKLLDNILKISQNSHVLLIGYFNNVHDQNIHNVMRNSPNMNNHLNLLQFIWQFVKYVISVEIYADLRSNVARNKFFGLAQNIDTCTIYDNSASTNQKSDIYLLEEQKLNGEESTFVKNLAFQNFSSNKKKETTILIYYFQLLFKFSQLNTSDLIDTKNCDHVVPQTWFKKDCWKLPILEEWEKINPAKNESKRNYTKNLNLDDKYTNIIVELMEKIWSEENSEESFIQLIGNKVFMPETLNKEKSNRCWEDQQQINDGAKTILSNAFINNNSNDYFLIPTYKQIYKEDYFGLNNIAERTSYIVKYICENSDKKWNNL